MTQEAPAWQVRGKRTIYDSKWVRLGLVDVEPPGTDRFEHHVVHLFRVAIALVLDDKDQVLMLRRYRFVPNRWVGSCLAGSWSQTRIRGLPPAARLRRRPVGARGSFAT